MTVKGLTYKVTYDVINTELDYASATGNVFLAEEYGTDFESIRKILAIPRGLKPENILVRSLELVTPETLNQTVRNYPYPVY